MRTAVRKNSFAKVLRLGFLTVLLSVLLCMAMPWAVIAGEQRVFDNAKLLDASEKEELEQKLSSFGRNGRWIWASSRQRVRAGKQWKALQMISMISREWEGSSHSGALIVIDMGSRELYISSRRYGRLSDG